MMPPVQALKEDPPCAVSDVKKDSENDGAELGQFPEGGTAAWCAVLGG